jgi:hypothetical protein
VQARLFHVCVLIAAAGCGKYIETGEVPGDGDAGPRPLFQQNFDDERLDCPSLMGQYATLTRADGRTGFACRVCITTGNEYFNAHAAPITATARNHVIEAWVKHDRGARAQVRPGFLVNGQAMGQTQISAPSDWTRVAFSLLPAGGEELEPAIFGESPGGAASCFLVDDVVVRRD